MMDLTFAPLREIYYASHRDAGCFVYSINQFYGGVRTRGEPYRIQAKSISTLSDDKISDLSSFSIIVPLQDASRANSSTFDFLAKTGIAEAINQQRCKLVIDYSNESCTLQLFQHLSSILQGYGIRGVGQCSILSQNRKLMHQDFSTLLLTPFIFDFFPLAAISQIRKSISEESIKQLLASRECIRKRANILCLNATPRLHRIIALLMMIKVNLINKQELNTSHDVPYPFISFPGFAYSKTDGLSEETTRQSLIKLGLDDYLGELEWLLSVSPLKVDNLSEQGNQLATKVILEHYLDSHLSVVSETGTDDSTQRITEKTLKPLALGHPFIIIGHQHSVELARNLGFSAMDHIIDHGYDSEPDPIQRTVMAVNSAKSFVDMINSGKICHSEIQLHASHNIRWAQEGLLEHYYNKYVLPVLKFIGGKPD